MRVVSTLAALFTVGLAGLDCQGTLTDYPPAGGCPVDSGVCSPGGGGVMGAGGASTSTGTGAGGSINQPGTVGSVTSPVFPSGALTVFSGLATIVDLPSVGVTHTAPYAPALGAGGSPGSLGAGGSPTGPNSFDLTGVPAGLSWLLVQDLSNGASGIYSTYSLATLPVVPSITLPVVEQLVLTNIASNLPSVQAHNGVSPLAAQVVLVLTHANAPFAGVTVTGGSGGAEIAYDIGPGTYSDSATTTGSGGTIILFNAALQGAAAITLQNTTTMTSYSIGVQTGPGIVTLLYADLE